MTWLPDFIEKAKKAKVYRDAESFEVSVEEYQIIVRVGDCNPAPMAAYIAAAYPERIIALGEVVEAAKKVRVYECHHQRDQVDLHITFESYSELVNVLTRLEALGDK